MKVHEFADDFLYQAAQCAVANPFKLCAIGTAVANPFAKSNK